MKTISLRLVVLALLVWLVACTKITQENFDKVRDGMSRSEVEAILGAPTEVSSAGVAGLSGTSASWTGEAGSITIQFFNDKVRMKRFTK
ncbi:outer membrane protein assembly factor BamE domain-containing protein [Endothiovibrio diazotrophicus]